MLLLAILLIKFFFMTPLLRHLPGLLPLLRLFLLLSLDANISRRPLSPASILNVWSSRVPMRIGIWVLSLVRLP